MKKKIILFILSMMVLAGLAAPAGSATLTVGSATGFANETLYIPITVDDPETLSGAAFTINHSNSLTVDVYESDFFDTFYGQLDPLATTETPDPDGGPWGPGPSVFPLVAGGEINIPVYVGGTADGPYFQPLLTNTVTNGTTHLLISAARCEPAYAGGTTTIFILSVSLNGGEPAGPYSLEIIPTTLDNTDAGYDGGGETIDLLIGSDLTDFTVLLDDTGYGDNVFPGTATFVVPDPDTDGDGILDSVEDAGCTDSADADTDDDGIPDGVEDANKNGTVDAGETNPCLVDTDGDGIQDGTELGYITGHADTDPGVFVPDADAGATTTDPLDADSDNDGFKDGSEDLNGNGQIDSGETDPNDCQNRIWPEALNLIEWDGKLVADFGTAHGGLYTYTEGDADWQFLDPRGDVNQMLVWDGNLVVDFGSGRGMYYYNGTVWTWMINLEAKLLIAWDNGTVEKLVVDFGPGNGIYTYPSATNGWEWMTWWDGVMDMIVWNNNLVIDFGCERGVYYRTPANTWEWMTNWDGVADMMIWEDNLVIDFGSRNQAIYYRTPGHTWEWITNWNYVTDIVAWDGNLVVDFGSRNSGIYHYNTTDKWVWASNNDNCKAMVEWDFGTSKNLAIDLGSGNALYRYDGAWNWLSNWESIEMIEWGDYLAVDFGTGIGIWYHDTNEWIPTTDWSTED